VTSRSGNGRGGRARLLGRHDSPASGDQIEQALKLSPQLRFTLAGRFASLPVPLDLGPDLATGLAHAPGSGEHVCQGCAILVLAGILGLTKDLRKRVV
jgi:hypothetical protein